MIQKQILKLKDFRFSFNKSFSSKIFAETISGDPQQNVIFLHGALGSRKNFYSISKRLNFLNKSTMHLIDQRNHGDASHCESMKLNEMADDISQYIQNKNLKNVSIVGHSMGAKVLMELASFQNVNQTVQAMVIVDMLPINYSLIMKNNGDHIVSKTQIFLNNLKNLDLKNLSYPEVREQINKCASGWSQAAADLAMSSVHQININNQKQYQFKFNIESISNHYEHFQQYVPDKNNYQNKLLIITGENSQYAPKNSFDSFKNIFNNFRDNQIIQIQNAGHWVHAEQPAQFIEIVNNFIKDN